MTTESNLLWTDDEAAAIAYAINQFGKDLPKASATRSDASMGGNNLWKFSPDCIRDLIELAITDDDHEWTDKGFAIFGDVLDKLPIRYL